MHKAVVLGLILSITCASGFSAKVMVWDAVTSNPIADRVKTSIDDMKHYCVTTKTLSTTRSMVVLRSDLSDYQVISYIDLYLQLSNDIEKAGLSSLNREELLFLATIPTPTEEMMVWHAKWKQWSKERDKAQEAYLANIRMSLWRRREPVSIEDAMERIEELESRLQMLEWDTEGMQRQGQNPQ